MIEAGDDKVGFRTEKELRDAVLNNYEIRRLLIPNDESCYMQLEVAGYLGIPDIVVARIEKSGEFRTFALELKLSNWKRALTQAFRYRAFSECVYVIMDRARIEAPLKQIDRFKRSNVGLVSVDHSGAVQVHNKPQFDIPYSEYLRSRFETVLDFGIRQRCRWYFALDRSMSVFTVPGEDELLEGVFFCETTRPCPIYGRTVGHGLST